jgi:hypothetical protein
VDPGDPRLPGATLYSSLEPCRFRASRPRPCAELIIAAGLCRVVIAWLEPPVFARGGGAELMRSSGVTVVEIPELAAEARAVNAPVLSDPSSVRDAAGRLFDAGVTSLALSPCVIGPETDHLDLHALAEAAGMKAAQPLGAQPALGQLAAMRYGAALQDPQMAGTSS